MDNKQALEIFKALSNDTRLNILEWLKNPKDNFPPQGIHLSDDIDLKGGVCCGSIYEKTGISQSTVSHYLDIMLKSGLVLSERHGKWTYFRRNEKVINEFTDFLKKSI